MAQTTKDLIQRYCPDLSVGRYGKIYTDTSDFMRIIYGDVIAVGGKYYLVLRDEVERSYGIEDPKYWVKRCVALETGERRILKLVFHESFTLDIGTLSVRCYRSPAKEARVLDVVRGDNRFMQGYSVNDEEGNEVRILELVSGRRLDQVVADIDADHRMYFFEILPEILEKFIGSCEAIAFLHAHGEKHGDIRRDHLWQETRTGAYRWIDFDYTFEFQENPFGLDLFGLGGLLIFLVGKGFYTLTEMPQQGFDMELLGSLRRDDFSLLFPNRLVNLKRLFPYIPEELNLILLHFSAGAEVFYESVEEFLANLRPCLDLIAKGARAA